MNFSLIKLTKSTCTGLLLVAVSCNNPSLAGMNFSKLLNFQANSQILNNPSSIQELARQVTVRIFTEQTSGSGVIIARQGKTYTVLTNSHVLDWQKQGQYRVMTDDEQIHPAFSHSYRGSENLDLALLTFESDRSYQVVKIGDSNSLTEQKVVYSSGFPNYYSPNNNSIQSTKNWGRRAFQLTQGQISLLLPKSLPYGYQLGYTNDVKGGMSGGPIFNQMGELVGINGRLKYPLQGISVFYFADGTAPSESLYRQMEALSWGIPVTHFRHLISYLPLKLTTKSGETYEN